MLWHTCSLVTPISLRLKERDTSLIQNLRHASRVLGLSLVPGLAAFAALTAGCAQQSTTSTGGDTTAPPAVSGGAGSGEKVALKVALITPGKISDKGWSQLAYDSEQKIKTELGAETAPPLENPAPAEVAGVMRNLAQQGNNLIFAHGQEYDSAAKTVAPDVPKTTIVVMGGRSIAPNLMPIQFSSGQATYLAGMVAGGMTKTNKIGLVGGKKNPIIEVAFTSFEKGAKAANPGVTVTTTFVGDEDIAKAKQQTQALLDSDVDVVMHNANEGGKGVADAVSSKPGAMFIGANADQSDLATSQNLGSFILDVPAAMLNVAKAVQSGKTGGEPYFGSLKDKAVYFKYNDKFAGTIPAELKTRVSQAEADIVAGKLDPTK
jgi:basic membrane lipoprotein Med (substrate-binding protein (PBP1-ABC) superfamily)